MAARAELDPRWQYAAVLSTGVLIGLIAGVSPPMALLAAIGITFVGVTLVNLTAGLCFFAVITSIDTIIPYDTGIVSLPKLMGILLVISWLAGATSRAEGKLFEHPVFLYVLLLFGGWVVLSFAWANDEAAVVDTFIRFAPNAMLFLITYSAIKTRDQALWLVGAFVLGTLISAAYGFAVPTDPHAGDRLSGAGGNANETAAALTAGVALSGALAVALKEPLLRVAAAIIVPLSIFAIFLTLSRGGLVSLGAVLITAVLMAGRRRGVALTVALVAALLTIGYFAAVAPQASKDRVTQLDGGTGRSSIWKVGWRMVEAHPVVGVGAGNFPTESVHYLLAPGAILRADFIVDTPKVAHNSYLEVLAELGIVGLALFLAIVSYALGCALKAVKEFARTGDRSMEIISRALFIALVGLLAGDFFGSREFGKQLWLLMSICPALLALARAQAAGTQPPPAA